MPTKVNHFTDLKKQNIEDFILFYLSDSKVSGLRSTIITLSVMNSLKNTLTSSSSLYTCAFI